jgi:hypothetical protein
MYPLDLTSGVRSMIPAVLKILADLGVRQTDVAAVLQVTPQTVNDWYREKRPMPPAHIQDLWALAALVRFRTEAGTPARDACRPFHAVRIVTPEGDQGLSLRTSVPAEMRGDWKAALEASELSKSLRPLDLFDLKATLSTLAPYLTQDPDTFSVEVFEDLRQLGTTLASVVASLQMQSAMRASLPAE